LFFYTEGAKLMLVIGLEHKIF